MSIIKSEPAICSNCGAEQYFTKVISWNTLLDPEYPANKCHQCGKELEYDDIDMSKCSPFHRGEVRRTKIVERLLEIEKENGQCDEFAVYFDNKFEEKLAEVENQMILEGLITTRKEEKEYSDIYFKELEVRIFGKQIGV